MGLLARGRGRPITKEEAHTTLFSAAAIHPPSLLLTHAHLSRQLLLLLGIEFNLDRRHESHFLIRCVALRCVTVSQRRSIEVGCLPVSHPHIDATYTAAAIHSRHVIYTFDQRRIFFKHGV